MYVHASMERRNLEQLKTNRETLAVSLFCFYVLKDRKFRFVDLKE